MPEGVIHNPAELDTYAQALVTRLAARGRDGAAVLALTGDLGAGKTALTKAIAGVLGVEEAVTSPTFVIQKRYGLTNQPFEALVHVDAYRLEGTEELDALGFSDTLGEHDTLVVIEWGDRIAGAVPEDAAWLAIEMLPDGTRRIAEMLE